MRNIEDIILQWPSMRCVTKNHLQQGLEGKVTQWNIMKVFLSSKIYYNVFYFIKWILLLAYYLFIFLFIFIFFIAELVYHSESL